jgi:hypothetical protein
VQLGEARENGKEPPACGWKEPVFSGGTAAMQHLPVAACLPDWQAEHSKHKGFQSRVNGNLPLSPAAASFYSIPFSGISNKKLYLRLGFF